MQLRLLFCLLLGACTVTERPFSLPAETIAAQIGPHEATGRDPRIFLADAVDEATMSELAPYLGKHFQIDEQASIERCVRVGSRRLIETRPDAILIVPTHPEMTGVSTSYFANPFAPGLLSVSSATYRTTFVGYALRAMRARLPFTYNATTGTVTDIPDRAAAPGLLEGDVLTKIDGADALPPKAWPEWPFYARLLARNPGDEVLIDWVRAGTGKMSGKVRLATARSPHRLVRDSIEADWKRELQEREIDGRVTWRLPSYAYTDR